MMGFVQSIIANDPPSEQGFQAAMMNGTGQGFFPPQ